MLRIPNGAIEVQHRLAKRIDASRDVDLFSGDYSIVRGHIRNISKDGALLEADQPLPYRSHVSFELCNVAPVSQSRRLRAVVIHRDDRKLGIMLLDTWSDAEWNALARPARAAAQS